MGCRKNLTRLTVAERQAFTNAVNQLRANGDYDPYVVAHQGAMSHGHGGPAFFSWHREFVLRFEQALQAIDPGVSLPYWDWTSANLNGLGTESLIWRDDFMGGPGQPATGDVTTGPFAAWGLIRSPFNIFDFPGTGGDIATFMASPDYATFRGVEGPHGAPHVWAGGFLGSVATAVRDPAFWLIHCNVDRLWAEWIDRHGALPGFQPFRPLSGGPTGHNLNDTMWPWNGGTAPFGMMPWMVTPEAVRAADLLDHRALGYCYDTVDPDCRPAIAYRFMELEGRQPEERASRECCRHEQAHEGCCGHHRGEHYRGECCGHHRGEHHRGECCRHEHEGRHAGHHRERCGCGGHEHAPGDEPYREPAAERATGRPGPGHAGHGHGGRRRFRG